MTSTRSRRTNTGPTSITSTTNPESRTASTGDAEAVVLHFLRALETQDHDTVAELLAPDLRYTNVSLPTLHGGAKVAGLFRRVLRRGTGFEVEMHSIASHGDTVMTERTDVIKAGPLEVRFWVCGTFRVQAGRIVLWRDYFDWWDISRGALRGMAAVALPSLRDRRQVAHDR
ncbi:MAG: limonene-1,2-epoxide hydrolase family protein [Moraxellaceae bacterium]|nr:limonene-1,2-epoxide hydrolase family protein [Moraxellaceae bacterium]